jgi:hypothetical protein
VSLLATPLAPKSWSNLIFVLLGCYLLPHLCLSASVFDKGDTVKPWLLSPDRLILQQPRWVKRTVVIRSVAATNNGLVLLRVFRI